jgi:MOSC domain-containing protein YiiM
MHYPVNVFVGKIRDYAGSRPSAIGKIQVDGELQLGDLGLDGDEQAEKKITAGRTARCATIRANTMPTGSVNSPAGRSVLRPGVRRKPLHHRAYRAKRYIGDIFRWGEALIQVTQPRSPCFKLNFHFAINDMAQLMQNSGKTGWLYRVIAGGKSPAMRRSSWFPG